MPQRTAYPENTDIWIPLVWTPQERLTLQLGYTGGGKIFFGISPTGREEDVYIQQAQGLTPWHTGLTVLPQALAMGAIMPFAGRIYDKVGAHPWAFDGVAGVAFVVFAPNARRRK